MRAVMVIGVVCGCGGSGGTVKDARVIDGASPDVVSSFGNPLDGVGTVEVVQGGYQFVEGPQWRESDADLVFSDIPAATIYRYAGTGAPTVLRMPSGNSNGLADDGANGLLAAEHGSRSVTRTIGTATTTLAAMFGGMRLNSPNDVIVAGDGTIYFTDPPYGITDPQRELPFIGVFRVAVGGALTAERQGALAERPNGIGLAPDGTTLYVDDTDDGMLYRFPIDGSGALGTRVVVAATSGNPDGLAIDTAGNLFVATQTGIEAFAPDGTRWGVIAFPEQPANCAFGDVDHQTLYVTARTSLYRVRLAHPGLPRR